MASPLTARDSRSSERGGGCAECHFSAVNGRPNRGPKSVLPTARDVLGNGVPRDPKRDGLGRFSTKLRDPRRATGVPLPLSHPSSSLSPSEIKLEPEITKGWLGAHVRVLLPWDDIPRIGTDDGVKTLSVVAGFFPVIRTTMSSAHLSLELRRLPRLPRTASFANPGEVLDAGELDGRGRPSGCVGALYSPR
jgi:hypothetical protein